MSLLIVVPSSASCCCICVMSSLGCVINCSRLRTILLRRGVSCFGDVSASIALKNISARIISGAIASGSLHASWSNATSAVATPVSVYEIMCVVVFTRR